MPTDRTAELRVLAQQIADALPAAVEEVAVTGSVSRGVADELSDIEMLVVTTQPLDLAACYGHARAAGLTDLDTWGPPTPPTQRVFGYRDGVPIELIWWPREHAERSVDELVSAEALANAVPLRTTGLLAGWQARLAGYPEELAAQRIEDAAVTWGGFAPEGFLTLTRPGDRLALVERLLDDASRVLRIVYALNRTWQPTHKRLAQRAAALPVKPERLAERIEEALIEPDPRRAILVLAELQLDTVALAPPGPNVLRARTWLAEVARVLRDA
jgi:hypothetical protein